VTGDLHESLWPLPRFYFAVDIDDVVTGLHFQEVSGLDTDAQPVEYRAGESASFSAVRMPGIGKSGSITLKQGVFAKDNEFFDWLARVGTGTVKRVTVTIKLLDESGTPTMVWTLANAWPVKLVATDLDAIGNEVTVESVELAIANA